MKSLVNKMKNKKGFTLMEMLIVVAIMVVLVAVAIPTFTNSLDKAKKTTDDANLRAARSVYNTTVMLQSAGESVTTISDGDFFDISAGVFSSGTPEADDYGKASGNTGNVIKVSGGSVGWATP